MDVGTDEGVGAKFEVGAVVAGLGCAGASAWTGVVCPAGVVVVISGG